MPDSDIFVWLYWSYDDCVWTVRPPLRPDCGRRSGLVRIGLQNAAARRQFRGDPTFLSDTPESNKIVALA
jgi:hypothetical protein